jgi:hypothetical protein
MRLFLIALTALAMGAVMVMPAPASAGMDKSMVMEGYIVDTECATANKADLDSFVKTHSKDCAMAPACRKSGYNLYSMGRLWKFDKESSEKVYEFLGKADSTLHVSVEMVHGKGDMIKLVSIRNAK